QVVGGVLPGERLDDLNVRANAAQARGDGQGVLAAGLVAVSDDGHCGAGEMLVVLLPPLASAARVAARGDASGLQSVDITFALSQPHPLAIADGLKDTRQPVRHPADAGQIPSPS